MRNEILKKYYSLNAGTNIAIRFFDGTVIRGTITSVQNDMISLNQVSVIFRQKNTQLKLSNLDIKLNTIQSLIYCLPDCKKSSPLRQLGRLEQ